MKIKVNITARVKKRGKEIKTAAQRYLKAKTINRKLTDQDINERLYILL